MEQSMEQHEKNECPSGDSAYPEGSEVCTEGYCLVCKHGQWVDTMAEKESF